MIEKAKDIYPRRGAENAKILTGIRRSDPSASLSTGFSREHRLKFATKVAPTDNTNLCVFCARSMSSAQALRETRMLNLQHRPDFR